MIVRIFRTGDVYYVANASDGNILYQGLDKNEALKDASFWGDIIFVDSSFKKKKE